MAIVKEERIGGQRLILGDCLEVMPKLGDFDAVVTDPPYGIGYARGRGGKSLARSRPAHDGKIITGDNKPFDPQPWLKFSCILWGANHFSEKIPHLKRLRNQLSPRPNQLFFLLPVNCNRIIKKVFPEHIQGIS